MDVAELTSRIETQKTEYPDSGGTTVHEIDIIVDVESSGGDTEVHPGKLAIEYQPKQRAIDPENGFSEVPAEFFSPAAGTLRQWVHLIAEALIVLLYPDCQYAQNPFDDVPLLVEAEWSNEHTKTYESVGGRI